MVECSLATQQDGYIAALEEECSARGVSLIQIDLSSQIVPDLRQHIIDFLRERFSDAVPKNIALAVTGLEGSVSLDRDKAHPALFRIMNLGRELYSNTLPYAFTIWLSRAVMLKMQCAAPDFWSWRSAEPERFVVDEHLLGQEVESALSVDLGLSWSEAVGWVTHLERLLEAYGQVRESDPTEMRLLSGLGDAYRLLEKYHNARERYSSALDIAGQAHLELRADLVNKLGIVMREVGDLDQALEFF